jgi:hypothetical protein
MLYIEDDFHAKILDMNYDTFDVALWELGKNSEIPFGITPNIPPCVGWRDCVRDYHIIEYDNSQTPGKALSNKEILLISATEVKWFYQEGE